MTQLLLWTNVMCDCGDRTTSPQTLRDPIEIEPIQPHEAGWTVQAWHCPACDRSVCIGYKVDEVFDEVVVLPTDGDEE